MEDHEVDERYDDAEELANGITHGVGLAMGLVALVLSVTAAVRRGDAFHVVGAGVFGTSLVLLYTASTFYHSLPVGRAKRVFGILDHAAIFLLIAGTYTPFTLGPLRGRWGWWILGIVWVLAIAGVLLETLSRGRLRRLQLALYLAMGWMIVGAIGPLRAHVPTEGLLLLLAGGLSYTLGVIFFVWRSLRFHHAIWHLFVLAGSVLHVCAVLLYAIPQA